MWRERERERGGEEGKEKNWLVKDDYNGGKGRTCLAPPTVTVRAD